jgi:hypothetical protein
MLSIEKCNKILNKKKQKYSQQEIKQIIKTLYQVAEIIYESKLMNDEKPQR